MFKITCAEYNNYVDFVIGSENHPKLEPSIPTGCMIELSNYTDEDILLKKIEFDYDIQINDTEEFKFEKLNYNFSEKDKHIILSDEKGLNIEKPQYYDDNTESANGVPMLSFNFRIKVAPSSDKFIITIKNIKLISDKKIYNHVNHSSIFDIKID